MKIRSILKFVAFPLFLGFLFYQFRPPGDGLIDSLKFYNDFFQKSSSKVPDFCLYNLPDGLWAFALTSLIVILWKNYNPQSMKIWLAIVLIFIIFQEFFQKIKILPGTFDPLDIITMIFGFILSVFLLNK